MIEKINWKCYERLVISLLLPYIFRARLNTLLEQKKILKSKNMCGGRDATKDVNDTGKHENWTWTE